MGPPTSSRRDRGAPYFDQRLANDDASGNREWAAPLSDHVVPPVSAVGVDGNVVGVLAV